MYKLANQPELQMAALINEARAQEGVAPLKIEVHLNQSASVQSHHMDATDELTHEGPGGNTVADRVEEAGFDLKGSWRITENVGYIQNAARPEPSSLKLIHDAFLKSAGHRDNILDTDVSYVGVNIHQGLMVNTDGIEVPTLFFTVNFGATSGQAIVQEPGSNMLTVYEDGQVVFVDGDPLQFSAGDDDQQSLDDYSDGPTPFEDDEEETDHGSGGGGCFVATAAYGDRLHPEVVALRRFRELRLRKSMGGRALISIYGVIGPVLARFVNPRKPSGRIARRVLSPAALRFDPWGRRQLRISADPVCISHLE